MFSSRLLELCDNGLRYTEWFGIIAMKYEPKSKKFYYHASKFLATLAIFYFLEFIFWVYRTVEAKYLGNKADFHMSFLFVLLGIFALGTWVLFLFNVDKTTGVINSFLRWTWHFQGKMHFLKSEIKHSKTKSNLFSNFQHLAHWMPTWDYNSSSTGKIFEDFIYVLGISLIISIQIMIFIQHLIFPETICFLYSIVPLRYKSIWTLALSIIFNQFTGLIFTSNMSCLGFTVLCYLCKPYYFLVHF